MSSTAESRLLTGQAEAELCLQVTRREVGFGYPDPFGPAFVQTAAASTLPLVCPQDKEDRPAAAKAVAASTAPKPQYFQPNDHNRQRYKRNEIHKSSKPAFPGLAGGAASLGYGLYEAGAGKVDLSPQTVEELAGTSTMTGCLDDQGRAAGSNLSGG